MYISFIAIPNIISSAYLSYYTIGMVPSKKNLEFGSKS